MGGHFQPTKSDDSMIKGLLDHNDCETGLPMKVNVCKSINNESYLIIIQVLEEEYAQFFTTVLGWKISLKVQLHLNKVLM